MCSRIRRIFDIANERKRETQGGAHLQDLRGWRKNKIDSRKCRRNCRAHAIQETFYYEYIFDNLENLVSFMCFYVCNFILGGLRWVWVGFGLGLDWVWIGFGLGLDWVWFSIENLNFRDNEPLRF